ncbi:MAG: hypothetical protein ABGW96_01320 [Methylophilaceae bacterium]|jgi:ABC-type transport system involved in cytochrome bd biosynthesis fused ATPase/permease subunit
MLDALNTPSENTLHFAYTDRIQPINAVDFNLSKGGSIAIMGISGTEKPNNMFFETRNGFDLSTH